MAIRIVRLGSPRHAGEGLRIGTVRHPPRGVPKSRHASENWYDAWLPELAPGAPLVKIAQAAKTPAQWARFMRRYRSEMARPEKAHLLNVLAALSHTTDFSVGCYCEDESHCHRSALGELLKERGGRFA
jgi:uncharacterized protein YeaO (DUF488 family)